MPKKNIFTISITQITIGGLLGVIVGFVGYHLTYTLIAKSIIGDRIQHGFWIGSITFLSLSATYYSAIFAVAKGMRIASRFFGEEIDRRKTFRGAFLGAPAVIVLILLSNVGWDELIAPNALLRYFFAISRIFSIILTLPLRILLLMRVPIELILVVAAPIGGILGYRLNWETVKPQDILTT